MKKSLIAGAGIAALGLAVVPFAGVFAANPLTATMTDNLTVNVDPTCVFTEATAAPWTSIDKHDYQAVDMTMNDLKEGIATTNMKVVCNDAKGYKVTVTAATDLVGPETATAGTYNKISFTSGNIAAGTSAGWQAERTTSSLDTKDYNLSSVAGDSNNTVLAKDSATAGAGDTATIKYNVATSENQAAGTYKGSITYTLTANSLTQKQ